MNYFDTDDRSFASDYAKYGVFSTDDTLPYKASKNSACGKYVHPSIKDKKLKRKITITEEELHDLIKEAIKEVLKLIS